jgi:hypothetical protein
MDPNSDHLLTFLGVAGNDPILLKRMGATARAQPAGRKYPILHSWRQRQ